MLWTSEYPKLFLGKPGVSDVYHTERGYLEIDQRLEVFNKKVGAVNQILTMFSEEQKHKDSSHIEIIINALIFIEKLMLIYFEYLK